jgi:hypothetical protein
MPGGGTPTVGGTCPTCTLAIAPGQSFCVAKDIVRSVAADKFALLESVQGNPPPCAADQICVPTVDPTTGQPTPVAQLCQSTPGTPGPTAPGAPGIGGGGALALPPCGQGRGKCVPQAIATQQNAQAAQNLTQKDCAAGNLCVPNRLVGNPPGSPVQYQACQADLGFLGVLAGGRGLLGGGGGGGLGGLLGGNQNIGNTLGGDGQALEALRGLLTGGQGDGLGLDGLLGRIGGGNGGGGLGGLGGILGGGNNQGLDLRGSCLDIENDNNPGGIIARQERLGFNALTQANCPNNEICTLCNAPEIGIGGGSGGPTNAPGCTQLYGAGAGYYPEFGIYDNADVWDDRGTSDVFGGCASSGNPRAWAMVGVMLLISSLLALGRRVSRKSRP